MAPKKAKKISLNEFLGDDALGSWADEMNALPSAPAARTDEEMARGYDRRDDALSARPDRSFAPPRDDIPIPTQPPYTVFVGNLAFDLKDADLDNLFRGLKIKTIKIIKDREEKPKGFGYVEFEDVQSLTQAMAKSGAVLAGRTIRVSVAEPPKERSAFSGGSEDDAKFDNPWRRDGPLPDLSSSRDPSRRRFDAPGGDRGLPSLAEGPDDWRAGSRPTRSLEPDPPSFKRKGSGFTGGTADGSVSNADKDELWTIGSKFKPSTGVNSEENSGNKFGSTKGWGNMGPPKDPVAEESDWRSANRPRAAARPNVSPNNSTPGTPQSSRRKLELLPRGNASTAPSPLSSPKLGPSPSVSTSSGPASRPNPFGGAKPVDVSSREKEVEDRLNKLSMSRNSSRTASRRPIERAEGARPISPPPSTATNVKGSQQGQGPSKSTGTVSDPTVRPTLSFASVASQKDLSGLGENANDSASVDVEEKEQDAAMV